MRGALFLDNLHVGQRFTAGPVSVTADEIVRFASEFDPQPFHLDPEAAKATLFKGLAASGWHNRGADHAHAHQWRHADRDGSDRRRRGNRVTAPGARGR